MVKKQKRLFGIIGATILVVGIIANLGFSTSVSADTYPLPANGKCNNNDTQSTDATGAGICQTPTGTTSGNQNPTTQATQDTGVTCAVEKVGWLVCPIMESMAKISDKMFDILANNFLQTDVTLVSDKSGTKIAWEVARNLANIMFIIAFIIIIVSQVTGQGLNNYSIKRMLPRLIIAAIAVNISYYICQLAVDITNVLGYEIQTALQLIADQIGPSIFGQAANYNTSSVGNTATGILTIIITGALAVGGVVWLVLGPGIAVITIVAITLLTIIIILLLRKALIVLLIVISPVAFVLYLLPNTERLFNKWMKMFGQLLMVFPVVGLLFGAGQLASTIILVSGASNQVPAATAAACDPDAPDTGTGNNPNQVNAADQKNPNAYGVKCEKSFSLTGNSRSPGNNKKVDGVNWTLGLVATGVAIAPLMAVYAVLKGALSAAGAIGGMVSTASQRARGGSGKIAAKLDQRKKENIGGAWQRYQSRNIGAESGVGGVVGGLARRKAARTDRLARSKSDLERGQSKYVEGLLREGGNTKGLSDEGQRRAMDQAESLKNQRDVEDVKNALTQIEYNDAGKLAGGVEALSSGFSGMDGVKAKAAMGALTTTGEKGLEELYKGIATAEHNAQTPQEKQFVSEMKEYMMQVHSNVKDKNAALSAWMKDGAGNMTLDEHAANAATYTNLTDKQFSTQTDFSLRSIGAQAALSEMRQTADGGQQSRAYRLLSNPETATELNDVKRGLMTGRSVNTPPPSAGPTPP
jgi:hypothetical protein